MIEPADRESKDEPRLASSTDLQARITLLRSAGADQFDPVGLRYIEALSSRATAHEGSIRRMLDAKLMKVLSGFQDRFDQERSNAREACAQSMLHFPHADKDLQRLFAAGDFKGLRRLIANLKASNSAQEASLSALIRRLDQHPEHAPARLQGNSGSRSELKAIRNFRDVWSRLSVDKQVAKALEQAPKNAGPINSHALVLRSLALMRDISPDYLNRFISYADTLLCLDQSDKEKLVAPKKIRATKAPKK